jgi:hypothetical protein
MESNILDNPVNTLSLSHRVLNRLQHEDGSSWTVRELTSLSVLQVLRIRGFGRKSLREIQSELAEHDLQLREVKKEEPYPSQVEVKNPVLSIPEIWWEARHGETEPKRIPDVKRITQNDIYQRVGTELKPIPRRRSSYQLFPTWEAAYAKLCTWYEGEIYAYSQQEQAITKLRILARDKLDQLHRMKQKSDKGEY